MQHNLFDADFMRKLEAMHFLAKKASHGRSHGERTTLRRGMSLDFSDYRRYQAGDDFRYIDWNVYSRLDRLFLKVFTAEEDLSIHLLLDTSRSMQLGEPVKLDYARKVAAALSYIALCGLDRVGVVSFAGELGASRPPQRGRQQIFSLFDYFRNLECCGSTDLNGALSHYARKSRKAGLAIVISDLFDPNGYERGLNELLYKNFDLLVIHVVDETEMNPILQGAMRLQDVESNRERKLTINRRILQLYRQKIAEYLLQIETFCSQRKIEYLRAATDIPFEDLILRYLRSGLHLY